MKTWIASGSAVGAALLLQLTSTAATAGVLSANGTAGLLDNHIRVCFVGTLDAGASAFVSQVREYLRDHQAVARIQYEFLGACAAPTTDAVGLDVYPGELRVVVPGSSVPYNPPSNSTGARIIPGRGCTRSVPVVWNKMTNSPVRDAAGNQIDTGASFGIFPTERTPGNDAHCVYNMRLGTDGQNNIPWRNHTLHEFGHSLGFPHEFDRYDARAAIRDVAACSRKPDGTDADWFNDLPTTTSGNRLTSTEAYDLAATMNYTISGCPYTGNYSNSGLGYLEKLSLHMMYPEDVRIAEYVGRLVIPVGENTTLFALWPILGASVSTNPMITRYDWLVDGQARAQGPSASSLTIGFPAAGNHRIDLSYVDFAGRSYAWSMTLRVLAPERFRALMSAISGTSF